MAKFIGVKMIEATPMRASMALSAGYKIGNAHPDDIGYEVTYPDGYKSWSPAKEFEKAYINLKILLEIFLEKMTLRDLLVILKV